MAAGLPEEKWKEVYANLKTFHDKAYTVIDAAIKLEEEDKKDQALQKYEEGLGLIDLALELRVECPSNPDLTWEKGCVMLQKMRKTKKELLGRIADIQVRQPPDPNLLPPPSYDEAMSLSPSLPHVPPTTPVLFPPHVNGGGVGGPSFPSGAGATSLPPSGAGASSSLAPSGGGQPASFMTYQQLGEALNNLKVETDMQSAQVIYTHDNVRLYFISTEGVVSSSSEPSVLRILQLEDGTGKEPLFYLQVGDWFYPLVPNVSPCFRSEYGAFILPDVHGEDGSAVGIMLPPDADKSVYNLLEDILHCIVTTEPIAPPRHRVKRDETRSAAVSRSIVSGAQYISSGLVRGAEKASEYINSSTPRLLEKITPDPTPRQVSPGLAKGAEVARNVTGTAVVVTGYVANKVGSATMALGRYLAPHIQKGGTRLAGVAGVDEATAAARVEGAMTLAAGAVEGFSTVYTGLEQAGSILGNSLTNNTVHIVEHKYGQPMGQVTGHTLHSIGNAYAASQNFRIFTPKNLAKKTAKDAGKAFVEDFRAELRNHNSMPQQNHNSLMQQQNHNSLMQQQNYNSLMQQQNHNSLMQQQNYNSMPPQHQMNGDQKPPLDKPGPSKS